MSLQHSRPSPAAAQRRILLVDVEPDIVELVVQLLEEDGHDVLVATTVDEALMSLRDADFDLVLADGLSGERERAFVNASVILRAAGAIPVVLFTAHGHEAESVRAAGFVDLIAKPFDIDALIRQVRALLSGPV
jgi:DNA-binding response OmpR family regulator